MDHACQCGMRLAHWHSHSFLMEHTQHVPSAGCARAGRKALCSGWGYASCARLGQPAAHAYGCLSTSTTEQGMRRLKGSRVSLTDVEPTVAHFP